jgi:uncharacterized protein (TIGR01777 family)
VRVVVTGSTGLIGSALVEQLRTRGDEVVRLVRRPARAPDERTWDPMADAVDEGVLDGADAVVHLAGAGIGDQRWTASRRAEILDSRVRSTTALASAMASMPRPPAVWVSGSAIGYYGDRGDEELDETSAPGTGFLAGVCRQWEEATEPAARAGIRVVPIRTGVVLSARGGALARQLPLFRSGLGGRLGDGKQWLSWISLADEVAAICFALDHPQVVGPLNLTAPSPVTNATFTTTLAHVLHRPSMLSVPRLALEATLGRELVREALLASQRVRPARLTEAGFAFEHPTLEEALTAVLPA